MRRSFPGACVLATAVLAAGQVPADSPSPGKPGKTAPAAKEKLFRIGAFGGKVLEVDEEAGWFLLRVHGRTPMLRFIPGNPVAC